MSLRLMREKGILTQGEYDSAVHDLVDTSGERVPTGEQRRHGQVVHDVLYGFIESDYIWDSDPGRSTTRRAGGAQVPRAGTPGGDNGRVQFSVRNSRLGFRLRAPEVDGVKASAVVETDFLGTSLPVANPGSVPDPRQRRCGTEGSFFTSPALRARHLYLKVETPVVDSLAGQYWTLYGWGPQYQPNTVEIQGVPGRDLLADPAASHQQDAQGRPGHFRARGRRADASGAR